MQSRALATAVSPRAPAQNPKAPHAIDISIGERIRTQRLLKGWSQTRLAAAACGSGGVTFQQFQKYENGSNRVSAGRLWLIAKALDVPVSVFFEGDIERKATDPMRAFSSSEEGVLIAKTWPSLALATRRAILELVKAGPRK
jgi:transcriptional regulator with XRE-family HTH domain